MSFGIIVRPSGYSRKKQSAPAFHPHFNRSLGTKEHPEGRYFHTKEEYYGTLKKMGLEPYDPSAADSGKRKAYKPSKDLQQVTEAIHRHTRNGKFKPSDRLVHKMEAMGVKMSMSRADLAKLPSHYQKGGFQDHASDKKG